MVPRSRQMRSMWMSLPTPCLASAAHMPGGTTPTCEECPALGKSESARAHGASFRGGGGRLPDILAHGHGGELAVPWRCRTGVKQVVRRGGGPLVST